MKRRYHIYLRG